MARSTTASGAVTGPYATDAGTLHLWHLNEPAVPAVDVGGGGTHLTALRNGATLGNLSCHGFGTALSTYDGGPDSVTDAGRDAYLAVRPLVNGPGDNAVMDYAGPTGAFSFEALVRIDFDPQTHFGTNADGNGRGTFMQIINLDADENTNRVCQFRLVPIGLMKSNAQPLLEFINLNRDKLPQSLTAPIPTNGSDAIALGNWYHVAVTYAGAPNQAANLKFYWTLLQPDRTTANLIGTGQMTHNLPTGCAPDFALGQTGRQSPVTPYPNNNFVGLIDEVRISSVARPASEMMFGPELMAAAKPAAHGEGSQTRPAVPASSKPDAGPLAEAGGLERWSSANWLITGALVVIAGLLAWVVYVLRRLVTGGLKDHSGAGASRVLQADSEADEWERTGRLSTPGTGAAVGAPKVGTPEPAAHNLLPEGAPGQVPTPGADDADPGSTPVETGFHGVLPKVGLQDVIQLECLNAKSSILEVKNQALEGRIYIDKGAVIHVTAGSASGEEAFYQLLSLSGGEFSLKPFEAPAQRTIHGPWVELLMEAARLRDEGCHAPASFSCGVASDSSPSVAEAVTWANLLQGHPQVDEVLVCTSDGRTLHTAKCPDPVRRKEICLALSETAKALSELLPAGSFEQVEVLNDQSRTLLLSQEDCHLLIRVAPDAMNLPV